MRYWVYKAEPRLNGMAILGAPAGASVLEAVVSWECVHMPRRRDDRILVLDDKGRPLMAAGKHVALSLDGPGMRWIALRAQWRAIREAWDRGDLRVAESWPTRRRESLVFVISGACFAAVVLWLPVRAAWVQGWLSPATPAFWVAMAAAGLGALLGLRMAGWGLGQLSGPGSWSITSGGIEATGPGAATVWADWTDLWRVRSAGFVYSLEFRNGITVTVRPSWRNKPVIARLAARLGCAPKKSRFSGPRWAALKIFVLLSATMHALMYVAAARNGRVMSLWTYAAGTLLIAMLPMAALELSARALAGMQRRAKRRRQAERGLTARTTA